MIAWFLLHQLSTPDFEFDVKPRVGLVVSAKGVPIIKGSGFQYYAPGWSKGYYSTRWKDQAISKPNSNTIQMSFSDSGASGRATYVRQGNKIVVDYEFNWGNSDPARVELNDGMIWAPPFQNGTAVIDGKSRNLPTIPPNGSLDQRKLGNPASTTVLEGFAAKVTLTSDQPASTFDGRKYDADWAEPAPVYWQGTLSIPISKGTTEKVHVEYTIDVKDIVPAAPKAINIPATPLKDAIVPDQSIPPLIPDPQNSVLDYNNVLVLTNTWMLPAGRPKFFDFFKTELERKFEMPATGSLPGRVSFDGGMSEFKKREGTYHLKVTKNSISVYGEGQAGLRNGIYRLLQMAFIRNGQVCLPTGSIEDEPRSDFRGVHLFVGPKSLEFHQKLWTNVLRPLGFNKVVLQCERTTWKSTPGIESSITMKQEDLVKLFNWYRTQEVEPIPLIQSLGHMEWFFENGRNLNLSYNAKEPYAIDPRKPEAREAVGKIWDEAIQALKPKTIHVGLDEVDMIGFEKKDPALVTELWKEMVPFLGTVAKKNNVNLMLWGDEGLAPGEAIDATNGDDKENAGQRRRAIPKGSYIGDWHYKPEQNHVPFIKSLQTWRNDGFIPIASTWYRPENIRGYSIAASVERVGTLQTTWNGYESSEPNMLRDLNQYAALVLAGDYAWSARLEKIEELPYDPMNIFAKMYNHHQSPLVPAEGMVIGTGTVFECGGIKFSKLEDAGLVGVYASNVNLPDSVEVGLSGTAKELALALVCDVESGMAEKVGEVTVTYKDGIQQKIPLEYGLHVRAGSDDKGTFYGERKNDRTCLRLPLRAKELKSVAIKASNRYSGLKLDGVTLVPIRGTKTP